MDTQYVGAGLVYHHTSPFFDHNSRPFPVVHNAHHPSMAWQPQQVHTSPPNSSASTSSSLSNTSLYSSVSHSDESVNYPTTSTPLSHPRTGNVYASPPIDSGASNHGPSFDSPQIESSIGPSRVLTRRRAHTTAQAPPRSYTRRTHSLAFAGQQGLREPSPLQHPPPPPYASVSSEIETALGVSPYPYAYYQARATSSSVSSNPRSASPANSVVSLASSRTSYSSSYSASGSNLQQHHSPQEPRQPKHRKQRLWSTDRKKICICHRDNPGMKQEEIAARFGVERSTVSKILKEKDRWLNVKDDEKLQVAKWRPSKFPQIEGNMRMWLEKMEPTGMVFTDAIIRTRAREISTMMGIGEDRFKASSGWVENFKARHGIKKGKYTGEGTTDEKARAMGYGYLPTADPPNIVPPSKDASQPAWHLAEPEYVQPEPAPMTVPDPVAILVPSEDGLTQQEVYVVPKVNVAKEPTKVETLEDAERMASALREYAKTHQHIISPAHEEVLREIIVNIVRYSSDEQ